MRARPTRVRILLVVAAVMLVVVGTAIALAGDGDRDPFERARELVVDADGFTTGEGAAGTLAQVAQHLNEAIQRCADDGVAAPRCRAMSAASGYVQVVAGIVVDCSAPGRFEARTRVSAFLDDVAQLDAVADDLPDPPPLPRC